MLQWICRSKVASLNSNAWQFQQVQAKEEDKNKWEKINKKIPRLNEYVPVNKLAESFVADQSELLITASRNVATGCSC